MQYLTFRELAKIEPVCSWFPSHSKDLNCDYIGDSAFAHFMDYLKYSKS